MQYPNSANCEYTIFNPEGCITLAFDILDLQADGEECVDSLFVCHFFINICYPSKYSVEIFFSHMHHEFQSFEFAVDHTHHECGSF